MRTSAAVPISPSMDVTEHPIRAVNRIAMTNHPSWAAVSQSTIEAKANRGNGD
jgi:hypothetical protein